MDGETDGGRVEERFALGALRLRSASLEERPGGLEKKSGSI
jgi:hypothetical protein